MTADILTPPPAHPPGPLRVLEQVEDSVGALINAFDEESPFPSSSCIGMPPALPATTGVPFHSASATTNPKPSLMDFWMTTSE